uniref:Ig-like domain-containing protein n=1 Tax=Salarias fasciatus TaxID=181472 RepID=A0A672GDC3_SALFA
SDCLWVNVGFLLPDTDVVCVVMETCICILPCHEVNNAEVIHWKQGEKTVHSYYDGQEQLAEQNLRFKSRTSLVEDQRTKRRTSLQLMRVQIQDEGEYLCYTSNVNSGPSKSFMNLQVIGKRNTRRYHTDNSTGIINNNSICEKHETSL